jgi:transposase
MPPPISEELAWLIVHWYNDLEWNAQTCADISKRSAASVYRIIKCYRTYGTVINPRRAPGRPRVLSTEDKGFILSLLRARPSLYLDELQSALYEQRAVDVSLATLSRALMAASITNKAIAQEALEQNERLRAEWQARWGQEDPIRNIWLDESGCDDRTAYRGRGWAPLGRHCVQRMPFNHGTKYSVLPALTSEGIVAVEIFEGAVNKDRFISFIRNHIVSHQT